MELEKIHRFAQNLPLEKEEIESVVAWIESSEENRAEYNRIKNLGAYSQFRNFNRLVHRNKRRSLSSIKEKTMTVLKYAAIWILAFSIGALSATFFVRGFIFQDSIAYNEVVVPMGESAEVILADQTHVWLNSGARLTYPSSFQKKNRDVTLRGEAYFEVKHDEHRPFHVVTPALTVEVLGTSFNVDALENKKEVSVTLVEGKVRLMNHNQQFLAELKPNENAIYKADQKKLAVQTVDTELYTSWKDGIMTFRNESLGTIAGKLEHWFNVQIVFEQEAVKNLKYNGSILKNKPVDQVFEILKYTSNIDYSIEIKDQEPSIIYLRQKNRK